MSYSSIWETDFSISFQITVYLFEYTIKKLFPPHICISIHFQLSWKQRFLCFPKDRHFFSLINFNSFQQEVRELFHFFPPSGFKQLPGNSIHRPLPGNSIQRNILAKYSSLQLCLVWVMNTKHNFLLPLLVHSHRTMKRRILGKVEEEPRVLSLLNAQRRGQLESSDNLQVCICL